MQNGLSNKLLQAIDDQKRKSTSIKDTNVLPKPEEVLQSESNL